MTNDDHPSQPNRRQFLLTGGSAVAASVIAATVGDEGHAAQTAAGAAVPVVEGAVPITLRINSTNHSIRIERRGSYRMANGDARRADGALNWFDPLFPSAISYSGNSRLLGPTNLLDAGPTIRVSPSRRLTVTLGSPVFWRQSLADGVYLITTAPVPQLARSLAHFVGVNPDVGFRWEFDRHLQVTALLSHFFSGPFLRETTRGRAVNYGYAALSYRF